MYWSIVYIYIYSYMRGCVHNIEIYISSWFMKLNVMTEMCLDLLCSKWENFLNSEWIRWFGRVAWKGIGQAIIVKSINLYNYLFINMPSFFSSEIIGCRGKSEVLSWARGCGRERDRQTDRKTDWQREKGDKFHAAWGEGVKERVKMNQSSANSFMSSEELRLWALSRSNRYC